MYTHCNKLDYTTGYNVHWLCEVSWYVSMSHGNIYPSTNCRKVVLSCIQDCRGVSCNYSMSILISMYYLMHLTPL